MNTDLRRRDFTVGGATLSFSRGISPAPDARMQALSRSVFIGVHLWFPGSQRSSTNARLGTEQFVFIARRIPAPRAFGARAVRGPGPLPADWSWSYGDASYSPVNTPSRCESFWFSL